MKRIEERPPQTAIIVYKVLIAIAAVLALILIIGTIYGLLKRRPSGSVTPPDANAAIEENIFTSLGKMRIPTAGSEPETVIVSIAFPYNKNDRPFSEELASRISWFKTAISDYFGSLTAEEIETMDTSTINQELLQRFNSGLRLGQIRELYITDFMRL